MKNSRQPHGWDSRIESTYNWYWLVDGLRARSYPVVLANPAQIDQYSGIKHADDKNDAYFLAELQRLNILPTGHIYDPVLRPVRDLLRRRMGLVHQRTALMLSFKSLYARTTGQAMSLSRLKSKRSMNIRPIA
jgi:transposase